MLLVALSRAVGRFTASTSSHTLTPIARRHLFYPTAPPPSITSAPSSIDFPKQSRAHVTEEQFHIIRNSRGPSRIYQEDFSNIVETKSRSPRGTGGRGSLASLSPSQLWESRVSPQRNSPNKYVGRTVPVRNGAIAASYAKLQALLRINNIRKELRLTERHEKKGVKRRRLRSERWRRKFADEVRKQVRLVTEIRLRDRMWGSRH